MCLLLLWNVAVVSGDLVPLHGRGGGTHVHHLREILGMIWHGFSGASIVSDLIKGWNVRKGEREGGVA